MDLNPQTGLRHTTLCLPVRGGKILLAMKKRGFGQGRWNGMGGKLGKDEGIEAAAVRELEEEIGIQAQKHDLKKSAVLDFHFESNPEWNQRVHVFLVNNWNGEPTESEEMKPDWFSFAEIPFHEMWPDDRYWLPFVLAGHTIEATFKFSDQGNTISNIEIKTV